MQHEELHCACRGAAAFLQNSCTVPVAALHRAAGSAALCRHRNRSCQCCLLSLGNLDPHPAPCHHFLQTIATHDKTCAGGFCNLTEFNEKIQTLTEAMTYVQPENNSIFDISLHEIIREI